MERSLKTPLLIGGLVASVVLSAIAYLFFDRSRISSNISGKDVINAIEQTQKDVIKISDVTGDDPTIVDVVKKVSKHIILPDGRVAVVTIVNIEQLQKENPIFFRFAKEGDKALLYADRAILYNPSLDKVIDIWHVNTAESVSLFKTTQ